MNTPAVSRAPLSVDLIPLKGQLPTILKILENGEPQRYCSIFFERKNSKTFVANLKQTQLSENVRTGIVLRIYDGYTLFEQATDNLDSDALIKAAQTFSNRVSQTPKPQQVEPKYYKAPDWKTRLSQSLENEITSQIPSHATSETPVHFGISFKKDPNQVTTQQRMAHLKGILETLKKLCVQNEFPIEKLNFAMAREGFSVEESIFLDRETQMSQTLYRQSLAVMTMSGANSTYFTAGGLGGTEAIDYTEENLNELIVDLKALNQAEKLAPGKYKVIFGPVVSGVIAHEAFGHAQEGDTCARGRSKAWDLHQTGEKVGNKNATILNNPAIFENAGASYAAWGSYYFDEEGWLSQSQVLLDQGKLLAPMTNLTSAIRLGVPRTANGKRESWANGVYTRQTNTYFSPGDKTLEQLLQEMGDGFLAMHPAGGMEDPKGMGIQVGISYLQEVKNGKLTGRVFRGPEGGDIQMTGYTPDVLNSIVSKSKIEATSNSPDSARFPYNDTGGCGKYHKEFVYAGCGGPYMFLDSVILG